MVIGNDAIYSYSCNKQKEYNPTMNYFEGSKYLFSMDIYKNNARDAGITLNFSTLQDLVKFRDCVNAFLKFSEEMVD